MANVLFKRGLQANLPVQAQDGAFYLTTDTNRLYVGQGSTMQLLNQTVQIKNSVNSLPVFTTNDEKQAHVNDFYYCTAENILCVWKENAIIDGVQVPYGWQQINPNTDTNLRSNVFSSTASNGIVSIYDDITDSNTDHFIGHFDVQGTGGVVVAPTTATTPGVLISGNEYSVSRDVTSNIATVTLSSTNLSTTSGFALKAGSNVNLYATGTNQIEITAEDTVLSSATMTLGVDGSISLDILDSNSDHTTATLANFGVILENGTYVPLGSTTSGSVQSAIYSKEQIDNKFRSLDGMTYKGTVGTGGTVSTLPGIADEVKNGDTYIVKTSGMNSSTVGGTINPDTPLATTVVGDMFIAVGEEDDATGFITNSLEWTYVPSGNDSLDQVTYTATPQTATNSLLVKNGNNDGVMGIQLVATSGVTVSSAIGDVGESTDNKKLIATISHDTYATTTSTTAVASGSSFTAISGITVDNGHITNIESATFTPKTYTFSTTRSATVVSGSVVDGTRMSSTTNDGTNDLTFATTLRDSDSDYVASSVIKITSDTIKVSKGTNDNDLVMNVEWGTF